MQESHMQGVFVENEGYGCESEGYAEDYDCKGCPIRS